MNDYGINVLSLFNGMGCIWLALDKLDIKVNKRYSSEIDKYAIKVNDANYPDTVQLGDVTKVRAADLDRIDLLVGGSPCQGFSSNGKELNFEDPRSKLFFEFVRLLEESKPRWFLLENVNMKLPWQDIISDALGVKPRKINSSLFSAQNRVRLYWTNLPEVALPSGPGPVIADIMEPEPRPQFEVTHRLANAVPGSRAHYVSHRSRRSPNEKSKCLTAGGQNAGNAGATNIIRYPGRVFKPSPLECERLQTVPDNYTAHVSNTQRYKMLGNGWTVDVIAHLLQPILRDLMIDDTLTLKTD